MVVFEVVRYKNFLSAGNQFLEIALNKSPTTLIVGPNGSGKTAGVIDAVFFALYGKPYRRLKKDQVINSINKKNCLVELEFSIGKRSYKVRRGIAPGIFEVYVDGELKQQDASFKDYQDWLENTILKMNPTTMKQIVFLGSTSFVPFMRISSGERRRVIEEILDIQVFSLMNRILKHRVTTVSNRYTEITHKIRLIDTQIELKERHHEELSMQKAQQIEDGLAQIERIRSDIESAEKEVDEIVALMSAHTEAISDQMVTKKQFNDLQQIVVQIGRNKRKYETEIKFFEETEECPTCLQNIGEEFKYRSIDARKKKVREFESGIGQANQRLETLKTRLEEISTIADEITDLERRMTAKRAEVSKSKEHIKSIEEMVEKLGVKTEEENGSGVLAEIELLKNDKISQMADKKNLAETGQYFSIISALLKDSGIKSQIIRNYLPTINSLIRKYLEILEFPCEFTFDENFEETMKSRYRDKFSYANFSEGQKMRIDLALMFTWRELARLRNSASCNLLVLDEIGSSSLDATGTEAFMRIVEETSDQSNIFIISHDNTIMDKFSRVIEYETVNNFSTFKES